MNQLERNILTRPFLIEDPLLDRELPGNLAHTELLVYLKKNHPRVEVEEFNPLLDKIKIDSSEKRTLENFSNSFKRRFPLSAVLVTAVLSIIGTLAIVINLPQLSFAEVNAPLFSGEQFLLAVTEGNIDQAKKMASGNILFNLSTNKQKAGSEFRVTGIKTVPVAVNDSWAVVDAQLEVVDKSNMSNTFWYRLYMVAKSDQWLVYNMEEIGPALKNGNLDPEEVAQAQKVFENFLNTLNKDYKDAGIYLTGKAKTNHEKAGNPLSQLSLIKQDYKNVALTPLYGTGQGFVAVIDYLLNNKEMSVVVSFFKTSDGWKIFDITQK